MKVSAYLAGAMRRKHMYILWLVENNRSDWDWCPQFLGIDILPNVLHPEQNE